MQPDFQPAPDRDLRAELSAAIAARNAAEGRAAVTKQIADTAQCTLCNFANEAERLKNERDAAAKARTEDHAGLLIQAMREHRQFPEFPLPALPEDTRALTQAIDACRAMRLAADQAIEDRDAARAEAAAADVAVHQLIDAILDMEAHVLAAELVATTEMSHRLLDRLCGLVLRDEKRPAPQLRQLQEGTLVRIDRRKAAIARNPFMIESHNFTTYLDDLAAAAERKWQDYARRLAENSEATFES